jgi:CheY-like chemotaxis protein
LHFNAKKNQDHSEFLTIGSATLPLSLEFPQSKSNNMISKSITNGRATPIDVITVDKYSRITLTKNLKKVLSISPLDKIIVYKDNYNKNVIFQLQRGKDEIVSVWNLTKAREKSKIHHNTRMDNEHANDNQKKETFDEQESANSIRNNPRHNDTLYKIPIILIDDEQDMLSSYEFLLRSEGYNNITKFSDSSSSLNHIFDPKHSSCYRLAIIDIRMPNINGIKIYQIFRIVNPFIKILFVTGLDAVEEITSIYPEIKPSNIIKKPFTRDEFISTVNLTVSNTN